MVNPIDLQDQMSGSTHNLVTCLKLGKYSRFALTCVDSNYMLHVARRYPIYGPLICFTCISSCSRKEWWFLTRLNHS